MSFWKRGSVLVPLIFGLASFALAGTAPEWRPFDLGMAKSFHVPSPPPPGAMPTVEITLMGGFMSGFGVQKGEDLAANLSTGMWSPWFGAGYVGFGWWPLPGYPVPADLLTTVAGPMLKKNSGPLTGLALGFNISPMFQIELFFQYQFSGFSIDQGAWDAFLLAGGRGAASVDQFWTDSVFTDESVQKKGKAFQGGLNFNICFVPHGMVRPYLSLGGGIMSFSGFPTISWHLRGASPTVVNYFMDITYEAKTAFFFGGGGGIKFYLGPNYGLKLEGRVAMVMVSLDKILDTDFNQGGGWILYTPYSGTILTEKGSPVMAGGTIGFFFGF